MIGPSFFSLLPRKTVLSSMVSLNGVARGSRLFAGTTQNDTLCWATSLKEDVRFFFSPEA